MANGRTFDRKDAQAAILFDLLQEYPADDYLAPFAREAALRRHLADMSLHASALGDGKRAELLRQMWAWFRLGMSINQVMQQIGPERVDEHGLARQLGA